MSNNIEELLKQDQASDSETQDVEVKTDTDQDKDPLKSELERVTKKDAGRSELEKAIFKKKQIESRIRELQGESGGEADPDDIDDNAPVTVGMLKSLQRREAVNTAISLADDIENETERELVKYHINNSIKSNGNPKEDLRLARAIANAARNQQILEEISRKGAAKTHSSSRSAGIKNDGQDESEELSKEELAFMAPPFNMTKAEIIKARVK